MRSTLLVVLTILTTVFSVVVTNSHSAKKPKPQPCSGRYILTQGGEAIVADNTPSITVVSVTGRQISLGAHCGTVTGAVKAVKKGTNVAAAFKSCSAALLKVKLKASIAADCSTMTGIVRGKKLKPQRFQASLSRCGDGVVDAGKPEACDGAPCDGGAPCLSDCTCGTAPPKVVGVCTTSGATCSVYIDCPQVEGCCGNAIPDGPAFGETCDLGKDVNCAGLPCASGCTAQCRSVGKCTSTGGQCVVNGDCGGQGTCCGNHFIDAGETCDDGNDVETDGCPTNCRVDPCTPTTTTVATSVTYTGPAGVKIAGLGIFVDYPEGKVSAPTFSAGFGVGNVTNDLGYGFTAEPIKISGLPNPVMHVTYTTCQGASAATASDFTCTITDVSDDQGNVVPNSQVTCAVTVP